MQQQQKRGQRRLGVLAPEADDSSTGAVRVVVDLQDFPPLPWPELHRLANVPTFRNAAVRFDPEAVVFAAG